MTMATTTTVRLIEEKVKERVTKEKVPRTAKAQEKVTTNLTTKVKMIVKKILNNTPRMNPRSVLKDQEVMSRIRVNLIAETDLKEAMTIGSMATSHLMKNQGLTAINTVKMKSQKTMKITVNQKDQTAALESLNQEATTHHTAKRMKVKNLVMKVAARILKIAMVKLLRKMMSRIQMKSSQKKIKMEVGRLKATKKRLNTE